MIGLYKEEATYWGSPVSNGSGGFTYSLPVTLKVRWEERQERFTDVGGEDKVSRAVVFVPVKIDIGGYLFKGKSTVTDPTKVVEAYRIEQYREIPPISTGPSEKRGFL